MGTASTAILAAHACDYCVMPNALVKKLQYIGLPVLTVTQCSINAGRRFSEVELKVLLTHVSNLGNIFCYIHMLPVIVHVVIYMFTWDDPLLYGLYIGVPSIFFRDT